MSRARFGKLSLKQVEQYDSVPCPSCGGPPQSRRYESIDRIESPALRESPWACAILYGIACTACGEPFYDVEISVVPEVPPGASLFNDHQYKAAGHTRYVAGRGRREWNLVHLVNVSGMVLSLDERPPAGQSERRFDVPWLDEHNFNMMRWRHPRQSAMKLIETTLPVLRKITWPAG